MDSIYWIIIVAIFLLATFDLINGVANDAVNFLNSAVGAKAAPVRVILTVASIGVLVGALFSSGMMEVARNGIFIPSHFSFHEVMLLFLGVMIAEVILLDTFNTFGLPTSTTVSLVFGIMGSAVATAYYKISNMSEGTTESIWNFINTGKSLEIISGILLSVAIAFTVGMAVMWVSRLFFSFRYERPFKWFGALWCGVAMTAITYFAIFKGLKGTTLVAPETLAYLDNNLMISLLISFGAFSVIMFIIQHLFMVNILRVIVLAGTFSLALAFAGNDLVNFIGVSMAAIDSFHTAQGVAAGGGDLTSLMMTSLEGAAHTSSWYLFGAGVIMVLALWFSKKARSVIATGVELSRQGEGGIERFGSVPPARAIVRAAIALGEGMQKMFPPRVLIKMNRRWSPVQQPEAKKDRVAFDLIRASVNLTVAALLIAWATSYKLPLSTTYVTFMVAMGSSLADKAWGRESAVYRVTGVLTVISGWFMTGLAAFTLAGITALLLNYGEMYAIFPLLLITAALLVKSTFVHKKREEKFNTDHLEEITEDNIMDVCHGQIAESVQLMRSIYGNTLNSFLNNDRKALKEASVEASVLAAKSLERHTYDVLPILYKMQQKTLDTGYHYVQALDHITQAASALEQIAGNAFSYLDNNHTPFSVEQMDDLKEVHQAICDLMDDVLQMFKTGNYSKYEFTVLAQNNLLHMISKATKRQIKRAQRNQSRTRASVLYLNMLNDMRTVVVQYRAIANDQRNFVIG